MAHRSAAPPHLFPVSICMGGQLLLWLFPESTLHCGQGHCVRRQHALASAHSLFPSAAACVGWLFLSLWLGKWIWEAAPPYSLMPATRPQDAAIWYGGRGQGDFRILGPSSVPWLSLGQPPHPPPNLVHWNLAYLAFHSLFGNWFSYLQLLCQETAKGRTRSEKEDSNYIPNL